LEHQILGISEEKEASPGKQKSFMAAVKENFSFSFVLLIIKKTGPEVIR
jgi:hypothetical protein